MPSRGWGELQLSLPPAGSSPRISTRGSGRWDRRTAINNRAAHTTIPKTEERLVLATGRFIGEGFDDTRLDTLFLAMPVCWKGTLVQYSGRLHRKQHAKTEVRMMDYVDRNVPMLARMFEKRMRGYSTEPWATWWASPLHRRVARTTMSSNTMKNSA